MTEATEVTKAVKPTFETEAESDAYDRGYNHGHGIACHNVPTLGARLYLDDLGRVTVDAENIREVHQSLCNAAESGSRDYSPFEFTAAEFNAARSEGEEGDGVTSEALWEAFQRGTEDAISDDLATYTDDDYGLAEEADEND